MIDKNDHLYNTIYGLEEKFPEYSVRLWLKSKKRIYISILPLIFMIAVILYPKELFLVFFYLINSLYLIAQGFKVIVLIIGYVENKKLKKELSLPDALPIYTILLPIYKEGKILPKLIKSIENLDYPKNLLDVKLLIEEDDYETLTALNNISIPKFFEVIKIPISNPRTKPKACNYGLQFALGEYVVVYDAEDEPSTNQLKQVLAKFNQADDKLICVQARLNYYNRDENYLSQMFSIEYSLLFDYIMLGLKKLNMPIALGATSNHFITKKLQNLGGWDAFNVTEDADLGIRLCHLGYKTDLINNVTLEEATITIKAWTIQRSRWIKGHILTSLVHLKQSHKLKFIDVAGIILSLYLPNLIYILLPLYLLLSWFISDVIDVALFWQINLLLGLALPIISSMFIIYQKKWYNIRLASLLSVFYYLLIPIAGIRYASGKAALTFKIIPE